MPEQPLSSRLSLAQAVVSANSRTKAVSIGLENGKSAEEDGWGQGQPQVRVMGRDIRVMKRWGYDWKEEDSREHQSAAQVLDSQETIKAEDSVSANSEMNTSHVGKSEEPPALWGLDLEALRSSNEGKGQGQRPQSMRKQSSSLPIYTPESARSYLLKSFTSAPAPAPPSAITTNSPPPLHPQQQQQTKKKNPPPLSSLKSQNEHSLALLLSALEKLYASWANVLSAQDLDRRSWAWYVAVRPEIQHGVAGWGEKGEVTIARILELRR